MELKLITELEFLLRIILAGICGGLIGYERNSRSKEAGIRTHLIVSLASALIMVVSKYGFSDVLALEGVALDPSRVAAQIVSGVGFLGAGMIFVRGYTVSGLTTAAGVWATAGIGMAIGSGLYLLGVASAIFILLMQILMHQKYRWFTFPSIRPLGVQIKENKDAIANLKALLTAKNLAILDLRAETLDNGYIDVKLMLKLPIRYSIVDLISELNENPYIKVTESEADF